MDHEILRVVNVQQLREVLSLAVDVQRSLHRLIDPPRESNGHAEVVVALISPPRRREAESAVWYQALRAAAEHASDEPLHDAEVAELKCRAEARWVQDEPLMDGEMRAYCESVLGLLDHWLRGTATIGEVSHAAFFRPRAVAWRLARPEQNDDELLRLRAEFADVFGRMATTMLSIGEQQTGA